jgi:putative FmdB family regulatory protein
MTMPIYEFLCETCGPFEYWRSFDEAGNPMLCPTCKTVAKRVYSLPGLFKTPPALAKARLRAEKSAHEPEVVRRQRPTGEEYSHSTTVHQQHGRQWQLGH